jgi:helix-turn-helix protein/uncharacterized protein DUF4115
VFEIGNSLREARVRQQLELTEIELATKIRARYLRALEEESFDVLPAQTYVKGFLRTYADYLGLDGHLYVDEYNSRFGAGDDEPREPVVARRTSNVGRHHHRRVESRGVLFALAGIGALFAFVIAAWKFGGNGNEQIPGLGSTTKKTRVLPPVAPPAPQPKPEATTFRLYLRATHGGSWLDVRRNQNAPRSLFTGTLELGQDQRWVQPRLWINFGNPGNLSMALNGRQISITRGGTYIFTPGRFSRAG